MRGSSSSGGTGAQDGSAADGLSPYDRVTVSLWRRSHAEIRGSGGPPGTRCLAEAAAHAVLTGLRRCSDAAALFARYETSDAEAAELALIASLLPGPAEVGAEGRPREDALRRVREASFHLRWLELGRGP